MCYCCDDYYGETLWRISEEDIHDLLAEAGICEEEWVFWYEKFKRDFFIPDWGEAAMAFIEANK